MKYYASTGRMRHLLFTPVNYIPVMSFWLHVINFHDLLTFEMNETSNCYCDLDSSVNVKVLLDQLRSKCLHCRQIPSIVPTS